MLHQKRLETPDCAETTQEKTPHPQKDKDNILPPSSSRQLTMCPAQAITETMETLQHNVEVLKQGWVERRDGK